MGLFAVVQQAYEVLAPEVLAPILQQSLGLLPYDAVRMAREGRGIVAENLDETEANGLWKAMNDGGHPVVCIPQEQVVRVGKPLLARTIYVGEEALEVVLGYTDEIQLVLWNSIRFMSAGEILELKAAPAARPQRRTHFFAKSVGLSGILGVPGIAAGLALAADEAQRARGASGPGGGQPSVVPVLLADLFAVMPAGEYLHLRLKARDLRYDEILGEGAAKNYLTDFKEVLWRIAQKSLQAAVSPGFWALAQSARDPAADLSESRFGFENEFTQYNRWSLQMLALEPGTPDHS